jgi:hypothetical protein
MAVLALAHIEPARLCGAIENGRAAYPWGET